jgi:uncharacterized membrane protein
MPDLTVIRFKRDTSRALHMLNQLRHLETRWEIGMEYGIAVHREADGTLHVQEGDALTKDEGMARGAFRGSIVGMVLAIPFVAVHPSMAGAAIIGGGALLGVVAGATIAAIAAGSWKDQTVAERTVVRDLGTLVEPGDSVIAALIEASNPAAVQTLFAVYDGTVLELPLPAAQAEEVTRYLKDRSAHMSKEAA